MWKNYGYKNILREKDLLVLGLKVKKNTQQRISEIRNYVLDDPKPKLEEP